MTRDDHREGSDGACMSEQKADSYRNHERSCRPRRRQGAQVRIGDPPPHRQVGKARAADQHSGAARDRSRTAADPRDRQPRHDEAGDKRNDRRCGAEQQRQIDRDDDRIAGPGYESRKAGADAHSRCWSEEDGGQHSDSQGTERGNRKRTTCAGCRSKYEAVDAGVEITERTQLHSQLVDTRFGCRKRTVILGAVHRYRLRLATNTDSSRSRSARRPNGCRARSAVSHNSRASCRAPSTPLNDTKVVLRTSSLTSLPVSAGSPSTSNRSSMIWKASPRFLA